MCLSFHRPIFSAPLLVAGGIALGGASPAPGQECRLSVHTSAAVLAPGESATVSVLASFPRPPAANAPYAFASAAFDVRSSQPAWMYASDGVIADDGVFGIDAGQPHSPQSGVFADPANPYRVWNGRFVPTSDEAALVEFAVDPSGFSVYPSKLTASSAPCTARGGRGFLFVNPVPVGAWLAAPGQGTEMRVHDDVIVDGRIITGQDFDSARIGLRPLAETVRSSKTRVAVLGQPVTFTVTVQAAYNRPDVMGEMAISFVGLENENGGVSGYRTGANFLLGDGSVRSIRYQTFRGGVFVAAGDLTGDALMLSDLPQVIEGHAGDDLLIGGTTSHAMGGQGRDVLLGGAGADVAVAQEPARRLDGFVVEFDRPVDAVVRGRDGRPRAVSVDRVEISAARMSTANNLRQIGLACHHFEVRGVQGLSVAPMIGR